MAPKGTALRMASVPENQRSGESASQFDTEYLEELAGMSTASDDASEFKRLSESAQGDSQGWKFNREELHERR